MDLISVIVPVYKVEPYLDRCVQSIVDQTYRNLEIILVDDGSPDRCGEMCDAWAEKDSRIRVIHKENGGLSDARNAGMAAATGDWIAFVDSDDWIGANMYEVLLNAAKKTECRVVSCEVKRFYEQQQPNTEMHDVHVDVLTQMDGMRELIKDRRVQQLVVNKLYWTKIVSNIPFAVGKCHEDEFWTYQVIAQIDRIAVTDHVGYYYLQRTGSIMAQTFSRKRLDAMEAKCLRHELITKQMPELMDVSLNSLWGACLYQGQCALRQLKGKERSEILRYLKKVQKEHPLPKKRPEAISKKYWLWYQMARQSFETVCAFRNALKIGG